MVFTLIPLLISSLALVISLISLWKTQFSPFKLQINHSTPTFTLYEITPEMSGNKLGRTWWVPCFNLGISFCNLGQQTGEVIDLRIVAELTANENVRKHAFFPKWVVDYSSFQKYQSDRFRWIESSVIREWYPISLAGKESKSMHLIFEPELVRWDDIETGMMTFCLEVFSSREKKWLECDRYSLSITKDMYESGASTTPWDSKLGEIRRMSTETEKKTRKGTN